MKLVVNKCYGGFGLSEKAYEKLIEYGIPVRKYIEQERDPKTLLYKPEPLNDGEVIFDRDLNDPAAPGKTDVNASLRRLDGRYWENWIRHDNRSHPLVVRVVDELGSEADGRHAKLEIVEIPDDVEYEIDEYDGIESIHEVHRSW